MLDSLATRQVGCTDESRDSVEPVLPIERCWFTGDRLLSVAEQPEAVQGDQHCRTFVPDDGEG
jgi:hypothetical protein